MALTEREKETIMSNIKAKIRGSCPMCGGNQWNLENEIVGTVAASIGGGLGFGGPYVPMAQVICNNCGFVAHHAVGLLGIKLQ